MTVVRPGVQLAVLLALGLSLAGCSQSSDDGGTTAGTGDGNANDDGPDTTAPGAGEDATTLLGAGWREPLLLDLAVAPAGDGAVTVSWLAAGDVARTNVTYAAPGGATALGPTLPGGGYQDARLEGLLPDTTYAIRIEATGLDGETASAELSYTTPAEGDADLGLRILDIQATSLGKYQATIQYQVAGAADGAPSWVDYGVGNLTRRSSTHFGNGLWTVTLWDLEAGTSYNYAVRIESADGTFTSPTSSFSTSGGFVSYASIASPSYDGSGGGGGGGGGDDDDDEDTLPPTITAISTTVPTSSSVTIGWTVTDPSGVAWSRLEYSVDTSYGLSTPDQAGAGAKTAPLSGLADDTTYNFRIRAADTEGNWVLSDVQQFTTAAASPPMSVSTTGWPAGGPIPAPFACPTDAQPALAIADVPAGTVELALRFDDPDAGGFVHWIWWDMGPAVTTIPAGADITSLGGIEGINDFGPVGYAGPCPPPGPPHQYVLTLYALNAPLGLAAGADGFAFDAALVGKVVSTATYNGFFGM